MCLLLFLLICALLRVSSCVGRGNAPCCHERVSVVSSLSVAAGIVGIAIFIILTFGGLFGKGVAM